MYYEKQSLTFDELPSAVNEIQKTLKLFEKYFEQILQHEQPASPDPEPYCYGIKGLAEFLNVSVPTSQKIKNSGRIPYSQSERTILFNKAEVLAALSNKKNKSNKK